MPRRTHPYLCYYSNILHGVEIIQHYRDLTMVNDSLTHSPFWDFVHRLNFKKLGRVDFRNVVYFLNLDDGQSPTKRRLCQ